MRKWLLIFVMAVLFVFPSFAFAQDKVAIQSIDVSLWPEYDKAEMLVIDHIMLSEDTVFPVQLDLLVPADAVLNTVAVGQSSDQVTDQGIEYTTAKDGEWLVISITATGPAILIEYYDPNLKKDGDLRSYTYRWLSDYDVADFVVIFQEPFDATEFKSSLPLQDDGVHPDNMQYYFSNVGPVPAGEELIFNVSYRKSTDTLSVSRLEIQPVDVNENTSGRVSLDNYLPYIIGGFGVILIRGRTCVLLAIWTLWFEEVPPQTACARGSRRSPKRRVLRPMRHARARRRSFLPYLWFAHQAEGRVASPCFRSVSIKKSNVPQIYCGTFLLLFSRPSRVDCL